MILITFPNPIRKSVVCWKNSCYSGERSPRKILQILPSFKLGNSISTTQADTKLVCNYEHFFLENWQFNHTLIPPVLHIYNTERLTPQPVFSAMTHGI